MATIITHNIGAAPNDGTGNPLRQAFADVNANNSALNTELVATTARSVANESAIAGLGALASLNTVGTAQVDNNAVTLAKLADIASSSILGRVAGGTGDPEVLTATQVRTLLNVADGATANTGALADLDTVNTAQIEANAVTLTELADIASGSILGRVTAAAGDPEVLTATQVRTLLNVADGATANTGALADLDTVGTAQIDNNAVTTAKILDLNVTESKLAANAATNSKIADNAVTNPKIANDAVTAAKILDANVTGPKIAANAVGTANILDANVTGPKIADDAVTTAKILNDNVTTAKVADRAITALKLGTALDVRTGTSEVISSADHRETLWLTNAGTVGLSFQVDIAEGTEVTVVNISGAAAAIAAGSHTLFGATAIPQNEIAHILVGNTVSGSNRRIFAEVDETSGAGGTDDQTAAEVPFTPAGGIAAANVQLAIEELDTEKAAVAHNHTLANITDSGALAALNTVGTAQIDNDAVTTAKILDANVTTAKILDANVTTAKIADNNITNPKIADGAVDRAKLAARTINAQTDTAHSIVATDQNGIVTMDNAAANTVTIDLNATTALNVGHQTDIVQIGAGVTTIDAVAGVTLNNVDGGSTTISAQFSGATLLKLATDTWVVFGNIAAVA